MALADLLSKLEAGNETPATAGNVAGVSIKPFPGKACTPETAATCQNVTQEGWARFNCWLIHFFDRDCMPVLFAPAVDHAGALAHYPNAIAAEPMPDTQKRRATKAEAEELKALVQQIYCNDSEQDQAEALANALADPEGALLCYRSMTNDKRQR